MPWKLISFILALVLAVCFIGFNLDYKCTVSLIFYTFKEVPVFMVVLFAILLGGLITLPFAFRSKNKGNKKVEKKADNSPSAKPVTVKTSSGNSGVSVPKEKSEKATEEAK